MLLTKSFYCCRCRLLSEIWARLSATFLCHVYHRQHNTFNFAIAFQFSQDKDKFCVLFLNEFSSIACQPSFRCYRLSSLINWCEKCNKTSSECGTGTSCCFLNYIDVAVGEERQFWLEWAIHCWMVFFAREPRRGRPTVLIDRRGGGGEERNFLKTHQFSLNYYFWVCTSTSWISSGSVSGAGSASNMWSRAKPNCLPSRLQILKLLNRFNMKLLGVINNFCAVFGGHVWMFEWKL